MHSTKYSRGTSGYRAPELLTDNPVYNNKVDIWAWGCILYELWMYRKPFSGDWAVREHGLSKSSKNTSLHMSFPETPIVSRVFASLQLHVSATLSADPSNRPSAKTATALLSSSLATIRSNNEKTPSIDSGNASAPNRRQFRLFRRS